jgi:hypothetical protein
MSDYTLPPRVTATIAHVDSPDGWHVYRLADRRGYTHREDTIRVTWGGRDNRYQVEMMRRDGWTPLLSGTAGSKAIAHPLAIRESVAVLFGMEDHG